MTIISVPCRTTSRTQFYLP